MNRLYTTILKIILLPLADKALKTSISSKLNQIKQMQKLSSEEINSWQNIKLQELIKHAYKHTKYYKNLFDSLQIKQDSIKTVKDLQKLPILTKQDIINNYKDLIPDNLKTIPHKQSSTGGSSGDPLKFLLDYNSWSYSNANTIYNWEKTGYKYGNTHIALGSTSLFIDKETSFKHKIYYKLKNKVGLNGVNMSSEVCKEYVSLIRKKKIFYIYGYASSIYLLAKWVIENKEDVSIKVCFTTSEILTSSFKETILRAFNCKILDCYGASDGGITAFDHLGGYFEVGYNCILRLDENETSNQGSALLTDLLNYAMPLINYKLGDELVLNDKKNSKHTYNGQTINQVIGRTSDLIQLSNGNILTGPGFTILFKDIPVDYYCIEKVNDNTIKCYIKKLSNYKSTHEEIINSTFKKHMGINTNFSIEYTDNIKYSSSGKRLYFIDNSK